MGAATIITLIRGGRVITLWEVISLLSNKQTISSLRHCSLIVYGSVAEPNFCLVGPKIRLRLRLSYNSNKSIKNNFFTVQLFKWLGASAE